MIGTVVLLRVWAHRGRVAVLARLPGNRIALGVVILVLVGSTAAGAAPALAPSGPIAGGTCTVSRNSGPLAPTFLNRVCDYLSMRQGVVQVALFDHKTGGSYFLSDGPDEQLTASVVKVDILAQWLHTYQQRRTGIPGGIPYSIQFLMQRMIEASDNAAATALFYFHGGCDTLARFNATVGLKATKVACQTPTYYGWGNTTTTAADQVTLMRLLAYGDRTRVLGPDARRYALSLLESIEPGQNWGVSCGPWSCSTAATTEDDLRPGTTPTPGTSVSLKNGWKTLPTCRLPIPQCPWQVNSSGWVRGQGRDYVLTVLTTRDPVGTGDLYGFNYGADTIQAVSAVVWANLK
jgi:hypothetical protein